MSPSTSVQVPATSKLYPESSAVEASAIAEATTGASFTAVYVIVNVPALADHASPSFTLKVNVTAPFALATGTYVSPPRLPTAISSPADTSAPPYLSVPVAGSVVMSTVTSASPESTSVYPQSLAVVVNVCVASSAIVAAPPVVVGASFTLVTVSTY